MLYKLCSHCGQRYEHTSKCANGCHDKQKKESNKIYDKFQRNSESTSIYANGRWKRLTKECKDKFNGLDIYEYYINKQIVYGNLSHHIIPLEDDMSKAYDLDNLIYLSDGTHSMVHVAYKNGEKTEMQELLRGLIEIYMREYG